MKRAGRQALERSHFWRSHSRTKHRHERRPRPAVQRITRRPEEAYRTALLSDSPTEGVRYAGGGDCGSERGRELIVVLRTIRSGGRARSLLWCSLTTLAWSSTGR